MKKFGLLSVVAFFLTSCLILSSCLKQETPGPSFEDQLKKDLEEIDAYLASNNINAVKDSSGVRYLVTAIGTGEKPSVNNVVYASYKGKVLSSGKTFADSQGSYGKATLSNPLLACWQIVLPKVNRGSSITIYSPSGLAYGNSSSSDGALPANSNVIFDIKLFDSLTQFKIDTAAIQSYLKNKSIVATTDPSGVRYVITTLGNGTKPVASSTITFNYVGKLLSTEVIFDQSTSAATFPLRGLIKGFQVGMPLLPAGSKATFYIPSALGYGPEDRTAIPGNSNLIFDVELVSTN